MPTDTRGHRLGAALDEFVRSAPDVEAAAVVSFDGLPMASALPDELDEDRLAAMSAALLSLGEQATLGLGRGQLNQVFVEGEHGFVFLMSARDRAVVTAIADRNAKIGFMLFEMRRAADRIGWVLESGAPAELAPEVTATPEPQPGPTVTARTESVTLDPEADPHGGLAGDDATDDDGDDATDDDDGLTDDDAAAVRHLDLPRAPATWADRA